ncbi:hypothetical protein Pcac1_g24026 [Phytophthora cactorum]|nr:hypothetical protein Pcac1_g24026 [Phytophthora cactorum]
MKLPEDRELCVIDLDWKKQVRRTTPLRTEQTQTKKKSMENEDDDSTPSGFLRASANAVEAGDLSEPTTFQEAVNGPDQVHWRKAIRAELESMRLRGVFRAAKLPNGHNAPSVPSGCSRSSAKRTDRSRNTRRASWQRGSSRSTASTTPRRSRPSSST